MPLAPGLPSGHEGPLFRSGDNRARRYVTPAQAAIAWIVQQPGVSTVIPGARNTSQASSNAAAGMVGELPQSFLDSVRDLYDRRIREQVHGRW